ncbi:MAG: ATP-binding cassette domain-containing protein [Microbacteriaceae bacterium]|nr:ATP-binding cassette domain-containing protein [Microbacteriaceae bacterium]
MTEDAPALAVDARVDRDGFTAVAAFEARAGRPLALVGPNGAGKSTLVAAIAGLIPLTTGTVRVGGLTLSAGPHGVAPELRRVGVVFQDFLLFEHLTVHDNVAFAARMRGATRADARAAASPWLERFELDPLAARHPAGLSGGQRQRVALARALASDPAVLLLDEPLAALDAETRDGVREDLTGHLRDFDRPVVLVTHDADDVRALADDVVVLQSGRVTQRGTPEQLRARPATPYVARLLGR